jgi:simple sugar transport system ATP-binding protein
VTDTRTAGSAVKPSGSEPSLELRSATKNFGAVRALKGIDIRLTQGEVVGLVGDNGAGKSTLAKILSGALRPDSGELLIDGSDLSFGSVRDARRFGIEMLYQDLALCDDLDIAENFYAGREPVRFGLLRRRWMRREVLEKLGQLGITLQSSTVPVRVLSGGQRQSLAIARAVAYSSRLLILDEPTAALGITQSRAVIELINRVKVTGVGVLFISHRMNDVLSVCDRVIVLYEGRVAAELVASETSVEEIVNFIVTDPDRGAKASAFMTSSTPAAP